MIRGGAFDMRAVKAFKGLPNWQLLAAMERLCSEQCAGLNRAIELAVAPGDLSEGSHDVQSNRHVSDTPVRSGFASIRCQRAALLSAMRIQANPTTRLARGASELRGGAHSIRAGRLRRSRGSRAYRADRNHDRNAAANSNS